MMMVNIHQKNVWYICSVWQSDSLSILRFFAFLLPTSVICRWRGHITHSAETGLIGIVNIGVLFFILFFDTPLYIVLWIDLLIKQWRLIKLCSNCIQFDSAPHYCWCNLEYLDYYCRCHHCSRTDLLRYVTKTITIRSCCQQIDYTRSFSWWPFRPAWRLAPMISDVPLSMPLVSWPATRTHPSKSLSIGNKTVWL